MGDAARLAWRRKQKKEYLASTTPHREFFGPETGSGKVDFEAANPQAQSTFYTILPREVRDQIYLAIWRQVGLSQHIVEYHIGRDLHHRHAQCSTRYGLPQDEEPAPESLRSAAYYQSQPQALPFIRWHRDCFTCALNFDREYWKHKNPAHPAEWNSSFLSTMLVCKMAHLEVLRSIAHNIRFTFLSSFYAIGFLGVRRPPIRNELQQILITDHFTIACGEEKMWSKLVKTLHHLPNLKTLCIWMDYPQIFWHNREARTIIERPRLSACFAMVPPHIQVQVSIPVTALAKNVDNTYSPRSFEKFVKDSGGLVDGATMDMVVGEQSNLKS